MRYRSMFAIVGFVVAYALAPRPGAAETTNSGYAACQSEALYDEMMGALTSKDTIAFAHLLENGCILLRSGLHATVLDSTWTGTITIRVYAGGSAVKLWTVREAVTK